MLKKDAKGRPQRVRAKGHIFMQVGFDEQLTSLGQEAYVEAGGELIVRGKPLLKRGRSLVEGLSDMTVFYIKQTRLQVIGSHRLIRQPGIVAFLRARLAALPPRIREDAAVGAVTERLGEIEKMVSFGPGETPPLESVRALNETAAGLVKALATRPVAAP